MIEIKHISKNYSDKKVINKLSYTLNNEIYLLYGKNGVGKTTLMNLITGIESVDSGEIINTLNGPKLYLDAVGIGMTEMSIRDNIKLLFWLHGLRYTDKEINSLTAKLYSEDQLDTDYSAASLGMKLKVGLSLLYSSKNWSLIVLDETLSGLDRQSKEDVLKQAKRKKCPVVIISHNFDKLDSLKKIKLTNEGIG